MKVVAAFLSNTLFNFFIGILLARFLGPEDYGRFAVALAVAVMIQTVCFDWARLAAARFYSERTRAEEPGLRATLDVSMAIIILGLVLFSGLFLLTGLSVTLSPGLAALTVATAVANGIFDLATALMRARFENGLYARLIIGKNLLSMVLTVGGAYWFGSAWVALLGLTLSMMGAVIGAGRAIVDRAAKPRLADRRLATTLFRYALPVVLANLFYQTIPLADRLIIARVHGLAESGQFSFAYDIGVRVVAAIGSMLDVLLFQIAVRAHDAGGASEGKRQIGDNIGIVIAVLLPACVGCWLVLPSLETLVAPPEFRGAFARYLGLMLPGLFCYGLIFFALQPMFQINRRTGFLIVAAIVASLANLLCIAFIPAGDSAGTYAAALLVSMSIGAAMLIVAALATRPVWPRGRDVLGAAAACAAMAAGVTALPLREPGATCLVLQAGTGVLVYGMIGFALDLCTVRSKIGLAVRLARS